MLQPHQENLGVGLFGVVRIQGIQNIVSAGVNTLRAEETANIEFTKNQKNRKPGIKIQLN